MPTRDNHMENFALKLGIGAIYVAERQHFGLKPHNSTHMGLPGANISIKPRKKCISSRFIAKQSPQVVILWPYLHSNRDLQQNLMLKYEEAREGNWFMKQLLTWNNSALSDNCENLRNHHVDSVNFVKTQNINAQINWQGIVNSFSSNRVFWSQTHFII